MATDLQNGTETSVTGLVKGIIEDVQLLTKQQFTLFKQELQEDFTKTRHAALPMVIGLGVALIGTLLFGITLAEILALYVPRWAAFAIVTAVLLGGGLILFFVGQKQFQTFNPLPDRTLDALKENVQCVTNPEQCLTNPK
jgi:uncharacterized membrane protein YqjE